jgi:Lipase (class 3)
MNPKVDFSLALKYAKLVQVAGTVGPGESYGQAQFDAINSLGYSFFESLYANDRAGDPVPIGYVAVSPTFELVAPIRGTDDIWEWIKDAEAILVPSHVTKGLTHLGFIQMYESLRVKDAVPQATTVSAKDFIKSLVNTDQAREVIVCGHSLGGALATLLVADVDVALNHTSVCPEVYTFASPRVGDHDFSVWYNSSMEEFTWRFEHHWDIVPMLPTTPPFEHGGQKEKLVGDMSFDIAKNHELSTYITLLEGKI